MFCKKDLLTSWCLYEAYYHVNLAEFDPDQMEGFINAVYESFERENVEVFNLYDLLWFIYRHQEEIGLSENESELSYWDIKKRYKLIGECIFANRLWAEERTDSVYLRLKPRVESYEIDQYIAEFHGYAFRSEWELKRDDDYMLSD